MKQWILLIFGILLLLAVFGVFVFQPWNEWLIPTENIELSVNSGNIPLEVSIVDQELLLKKAEESPLLFSSCGVEIDWGDGSYEKNKRDQEGLCTHHLHHVYTTPGHYLVQAKARDWIGQANVDVHGTKQGPSSIEILPGINSTYYYQIFPRPLVKFHTTNELTFKLALICEDGTEIGQYSQRISYDGEKKVQFYNVDLNKYEEKLRQGEDKFKVVASLADGGNTITTDESEWFTTIPEQKSISITDSFILSTQEGPSPLTVKASYDTYHPKCFGFELDWGDGSEKITKLPDVEENRKNGCPLESTVLDLGAHTYPVPGKYSVIIKTNEFELFEELSQVVGYIRKDVEVK